MPLASYLPDPDKWIRTTPSSSSKAKAKARPRPLVGFQHGLPTPPSSIRGHAVRGGAAELGASRGKVTPGVGARTGTREGTGTEGGQKQKERAARGVPTPPTTSSVPRSRVQRIRDDILREYDASTAGSDARGAPIGAENVSSRYNGSPAPIARSTKLVPSRLNFLTPTSRIQQHRDAQKSASPKKRPRLDPLDRTKETKQAGSVRSKVKGLGRETSSSDLILEHFKRSSDGFDSDVQVEDQSRGRAGVGDDDIRGKGQGKGTGKAATGATTARPFSRALNRSHLSNVFVSDAVYDQEAGSEDVEGDDDGDVTETDEPIIVSPPRRLDSAAVSRKDHHRPSAVLDPDSTQDRAPARQLQPDPDLRGTDQKDSGLLHRQGQGEDEEPGYTPPHHSPILLTQPPRTVLKRYWSMNGSRVEGFRMGEEPWGKSKGYLDNERRKGERERTAIADWEQDVEEEEEEVVERKGNGEAEEANSRPKSRSIVQGTSLRGLEERPLRGLRKRDTGGVDLFVDAPTSESTSPKRVSPAAQSGSPGADYWGEGEGDIISLMVRSSTPATSDAHRDARVGPTAREVQSPATPRSISAAGSSPNKRRRLDETPEPTKKGNAQAKEIRAVLSPLRTNAVRVTPSKAYAELYTAEGDLRRAHFVVSPTPRKVRPWPDHGLNRNPIPVSVDDGAHCMEGFGRPQQGEEEDDIDVRPQSVISVGDGESGSGGGRGVRPESDGIPATLVAPPSLFPLRASLCYGSERDLRRQEEQSQMRPPPRPSAKPMQPPQRVTGHVTAAVSHGHGTGGDGVSGGAGRESVGGVGHKGTGASEDGAGSDRSDDTQSLAPTAHSDSFPSLLPSQSSVQTMHRDDKGVDDAARPLSLGQQLLQMPARDREPDQRLRPKDGCRKDRWAAFSDLIKPRHSQPKADASSSLASRGHHSTANTKKRGRPEPDMSDLLSNPSPNACPRPTPRLGADPQSSSTTSKATPVSVPAASRRAIRKSRSSTTSTQAEGESHRPKQTTLQAFGIVRERVKRPSVAERFELDFEDEEDIVLDGADEIRPAVGDELYVDGGNPPRSSSAIPQAVRLGGKDRGLRMMDAPPLHPGLRPAGVRAMRERERVEAAARRVASDKTRTTAIPDTSAAAISNTLTSARPKRPASASAFPSPEPVLFFSAKRLVDIKQLGSSRAFPDTSAHTDVADSITSLGPTQHSLYADSRDRYQYHSSSSVSFGNSDDDASSSVVGGEESVRGRVSEETKAWWDRLGQE